MTEIELRSELIARKQIEDKLRTVLIDLENANRQFRRMTIFAESTIQHTIKAVQLGAQESEILTYLQSAQQGLNRKN